MISKIVLTEVLHKAMSTGADFAEVYVEHTNENAISMIDNKIQNVSDEVIAGVGIRIFKGTREGIFLLAQIELREPLMVCLRA